jgi:hypothetical protein
MKKIFLFRIKTNRSLYRMKVCNPRSLNMNCANAEFCKDFTCSSIQDSYLDCQKSSHCHEYIKHIIDKLPPLSTTEDLINLGIFTSKIEAFRARKNGYSPDYIQFPNKSIFYPKKAVEQFLYKCIHLGSVPKIKSNIEK